MHSLHIKKCISKYTIGARHLNENWTIFVLNYSENITYQNLYDVDQGHLEYYITFNTH